MGVKILKAKPKKGAKARGRRDIAKELRYMSPENIAADFPDKRSHAAIAAVFQWIALNGILGWRGQRGRYETNWRDGRSLDAANAIVLDDEDYEHASRVLAVRT